MGLGPSCTLERPLRRAPVVELEGRRVTVWRARIEDGRLVPVEVQPEGGRKMEYQAWLRGLR